MPVITNVQQAEKTQGQRTRRTPETETADRLSYRIIKRIFDLTLSLIGLIVFLIPMLIVAVVIRIDSPGSPVYKQERLGLRGKPFNMYKFRSMVSDAEADGPCWAVDNDPRCTRVGSFLRRSKLDELPQLLNIFLGQMSFVGPRPERSYFYDLFEAEIPNFRDRLSVKPGLTGHAQVNGGYDLGPAEKLRYDLEYIRNCSLLFDWKCILKTVVVVVTGRGMR